jgi:hypothetical protein
MSTNIEELVNIYLTIRNQRESILREYEAKDADLKKDLQTVEQSLLAVCNETNSDGFKTGSGTVTRKLNERFYCNDWDNFRNFVLEHKAVDLFERRIHQGNFKEFMAGHEQDGLPPGINVMREFSITVRKPTAK